VEHLAPGDAPGFEAITEVLMRLFGVSVRISRGTAGTSFYPEDRSEIVLTVDQIGRTVVHNATSLRRIDAMLRAARIHFVESYDWVLLLPEVRMDLINKEASHSGVPVDDFKNMLSRWAN